MMRFLIGNGLMQREDKVNQPLKVSYPKFKNGEATVRNLKIEQNFDYVEELFQFYMGLSKQQLEDAIKELKDMTPEPMNTMLDKQPREEAIRKRAERLSMVTKDVPPTAPVPVQAESEIRGQTTRARLVCSACKNPMKGHKSITDCPKNRKE
ncbi:hypothetical protein OS493_037745 [Desmophyllum pertusum]|uniref:Uncharacterized protein n=1 Tax=Desmophyllum pertusum TaxID=174260 RepID=A0A9W9Y718_9CNID|nr:hypothetical protein OS493_037745 [Desmophyllum pertusum]